MPTLPGVSRLIAVASKAFPRYSEGDVISLADNRLLLAVTRKAGSGDFAPGSIIGLTSTDDGLTWSDEPRILQAPWADITDVMSASLCRSPRGVHLFFLARGPNSKQDTRVYQIVSSDEGGTWSEPIRVSTREGYHVVNNARVIRTSAGRMIVPVAHTADIGKDYKRQRVHCLLSDDDGRTWRASDELGLDGQPLMEPGVAECADGSVYMTIRTATGFVHEARSRDGGDTWADLAPTKLTSPAAPSTVTRDPASPALWMFYINRPKGAWKDRNPLVFALSNDHGKTWSAPRPIETDERHSYGYYSVTPLKHSVLLTYYDWEDRGQPSFQMTSLRARHVPRLWLDGRVAPPVFQRDPVAPVISAEDFTRVSNNSGLLIDGERWRLFYTISPPQKPRRIRCAESHDAGRTWQSRDVAFPAADDQADLYHCVAHRLPGGKITLHTWRHAHGQTPPKTIDLAVYRYVSSDDGQSFTREPDRALYTHSSATPALKEQAGPGRVCNDAFDVIRNEDGSWEMFAAVLEQAPDPRAVVKHDNLAGRVRVIARATSVDGVAWSEPHVVLQPHWGTDDAWGTQCYGMQVLRHRGFYLGLLHVFHAESQTIVPEWAWSHNGVNWGRACVPAIALGDEGAFDSRMVLFGSVAIHGDELVYLYMAFDTRHNLVKQGKARCAIGRAALPLPALNAWLDALPEP